MGLAKIEFAPLDRNGNALPGRRFAALFNPGNYTIAKAVGWKSDPDRKTNAPALTFSGGRSRILTLNLFYDATESGPAADVRTETNRVVALTRIARELDRPPVVEVSWGDAPIGSDFPFTGVVSSLAQRFLLFAGDGRALRAELTLSVVEVLDREMDRRETDPELTTHVVKRGDTLAGIAAEVYGDPTRWRLIAESNDLDDPRHLEIGRRLSIPASD